MENQQLIPTLIPLLVSKATVSFSFFLFFPLLILIISLTTFPQAVQDAVSGFLFLLSTFEEKKEGLLDGEQKGNNLGLINLIQCGNSSSPLSRKRALEAMESFLSCEKNVIELGRLQKGNLFLILFLVP